LCGALASACGEETDLALDPEAETVDASSLTGGTIAGGKGVVQVVISGVGTCSGTVIHRQALVTASHCFDPVLGSSLTGGVGVSVNYTDDGRNFRCLLTGNAGKCTAPATAKVRRLGVGSAENDFAVVTVASSWRGFSAFRGLTTIGSVRGSPTRVWGSGISSASGAFDGFMRVATLASAGITGDRIHVRATSTTGTCLGDSGGPFFADGRDDFVIGVISRGEHARATDPCTQANGLITATHITPKAIALVNQALPAGTTRCQPRPENPFYFVCF
jgi:hypothetical protein